MAKTDYMIFRFLAFGVGRRVEVHKQREVQQQQGGRVNIAGCRCSLVPVMHSPSSALLHCCTLNKYDTAQRAAGY